jgi:hypothetical protein
MRQANGSVSAVDESVGAPVSVMPRRTAVISASIDTAISGGVRLPIGNPTGPCSRAISSSDRSNCFSRCRRASLFFYEPIAPT